MAMGSICMDTPASVAQVRLESLRSRTRTTELYSGSLLIELMAQRLSVIWILQRTGSREDLSLRATHRVGSRQLP